MAAEPASEPDAGAPDNVTPIKQLRIDSLDVTEVRLQITGGLTVAQALVDGWKIGKPIELKVVGHVDSRQHKAKTQYGNPTGDARLMYTLVVHDVVTDDDQDA